MKQTLLILIVAAVSCFAARAQMIGATNNSVVPRQESETIYRPTGSILYLEADVIGGAIAYGYQAFPYLLAEAGFSINVFDIQLVMPYIGARLSTPKHKHSLFVDFKLGPNLGDGRIGFVTTAGYMYKNFSFGAGIYYTRYRNYVGPVFFKFSYDLPFSLLTKVF